MKQYAEEEIIDVSRGRSLLLEKASNGTRRYIDTAGGISLTVLSSSTSIDDDVSKDSSTNTHANHAKNLEADANSTKSVPNTDLERAINSDANTDDKASSPSSSLPLSSMYRSMRGLPVNQVSEAIEFLNGNSVLIGLSRLMVFDEAKYEIRVYSTFNGGRRLIRTITGTEQVDTFIMGIYDLYSC